MAPNIALIGLGTATAIAMPFMTGALVWRRLGMRELRGRLEPNEFFASLDDGRSKDLCLAWDWAYESRSGTSR